MTYSESYLIFATVFFGLPLYQKLPTILCTYISSPVFLTFILFPVEAGLVNVSKIMGKLKKTHVIKGAAAALCSTLSVIWLVPILKNTSDNAGCQLLCKTAKLETLCGTLQKMANALCLVSLKVNGTYLCNNT